jgi:YD repeat-containing protein
MNRRHGQFDGRTLIHTPDDAGNAKSVTDARNVTTQYSYDALNRVTAIDYPGTEEDTSLIFDSYTGCANGTGRLCKVTDQSGTTEYAYDGHGTVS